MGSDEACRRLALGCGVGADGVDHVRFDALDAPGVLTPLNYAPQRGAAARLRPIIGAAIASLGLILMGRKVGVSHDLRDLVDAQCVLVHCILQEYVQCFDHLVRLLTVSNEALSLPLQVLDS